jgi:hypothetical protein
MERAREFLKEKGIADKALRYRFIDGIRTPIMLSELLEDYVSTVDAEDFERADLTDLEEMQ